ncbi:hypothetical protein X801_03560 [Opisthorchis viverrini]|uniref:Glycosyl hydrolase family 13 catalytic domain-containing protein n=1 Tax=Opisthorchis viverrini TaxID=6198 RepID=A0A1S8X1K9_OPIVI|nr:hypothetical protein X801_03560 [Opisthorchis viverrini]
MSGGDLENGIVNDEEVGFLSSPKPVLGNNTSNEKPYGSLLTREDLLRLESEEPIWRRVRLILLIAFWVLWVGLLAAAIVIIVVTPKCPPTPVLSFWQKKVGYWLDPFSFSDSNGDFIGDFKGIVNKLDYIKDVVGAGFIILSSIVSGHYSNAATSLGLVRNFSTIDPALGTLNDFRSLIKTYHRSGLEVVITLDFNSISTTHEWVKKPEFLRAPLPGSVVARDGSKPTVNLNGKSYYSVGDKNSVDLNLSSDEVVQNLESALSFGRENTPLKMVQELIKLREKPSLKWGEFEMLESGEEVDDIELFKREAIGHPAFIVAVIKRTPNYAATFNFAGVCGRFIPRLTYPLRPALKLNEAIDSSRIYLQSDSEPAVYVFECA